MRFTSALSFAFLSAVAMSAQVDSDSFRHFPADSEFEEISSVLSEESFSDPKRLSSVENGQLISDVGFDSYARRSYSAANKRTFLIEVIKLKDSRAAYSLLTLLRNSNISQGPPGDAFASNRDSLCFAQGRHWIRILDHGIPRDTSKRIAVSISNRIGERQNKPPSLISHFPKIGYDASSLKYFPGAKTFVSYFGKKPSPILRLDWDPEIAQARYSAESQKGTLFLLNFPTSQLAEQYYSEMPQWAANSEKRIYLKRVGPLLGILEGVFYPDTADGILSSINYTYSIQWIAEKRSRPATIWGVPVAILGTVVTSAFFVLLLGGFSVLAGIGIAIFRLVLRGYAPNNPLDRPERTGITQLRIR